MFILMIVFIYRSFKKEMVLYTNALYPDLHKMQPGSGDKMLKMIVYTGVYLLFRRNNLISVSIKFYHNTYIIQNEAW